MRTTPRHCARIFGVSRAGVSRSVYRFAATGCGGKDLAFLSLVVIAAAAATLTGTTRAIIALTGLLRLCVTLNCLTLLVFNNCVQGQLAAIIDFSNLYLDLLAHLQDVLDVLNTLATNQATDLRDVQQAILTRAQ